MRSSVSICRSNNNQRCKECLGRMKLFQTTPQYLKAGLPPKSITYPWCNSIGTIFLAQPRAIFEACPHMISCFKKLLPMAAICDNCYLKELILLHIYSWNSAHPHSHLLKPKPKPISQLKLSSTHHDVSDPIHHISSVSITVWMFHHPIPPYSTPQTHPLINKELHQVGIFACAQASPT